MLQRVSQQVRFGGVDLWMWAETSTTTPVRGVSRKQANRPTGNWETCSARLVDSGTASPARSLPKSTSVTPGYDTCRQSGDISSGHWLQAVSGQG